MAVSHILVEGALYLLPALAATYLGAAAGVLLRRLGRLLAG